LIRVSFWECPQQSGIILWVTSEHNVDRWQVTHRKSYLPPLFDIEWHKGFKASFLGTQKYQCALAFALPWPPHAACGFGEIKAFKMMISAQGASQEAHVSSSRTLLYAEPGRLLEASDWCGVCRTCWLVSQDPPV